MVTLFYLDIYFPPFPRVLSESFPVSFLDGLSFSINVSVSNHPVFSFTSVRRRFTLSRHFMSGRSDYHRPSTRFSFSILNLFFLSVCRISSAFGYPVVQAGKMLLKWFWLLLAGFCSLGVEFQADSRLYFPALVSLARFSRKFILLTSVNKNSSSSPFSFPDSPFFPSCARSLTRRDKSSGCEQRQDCFHRL